MTPADFNRFRNLLGEGSGFQSAMYRRLEFLLGLKSEPLVRPFRRQPRCTPSWSRRCTRRACGTR